MTVTDPELGLLRYGRLTVQDLGELNLVKDPVERGFMAVYVMLKHGYPDLSISDVEAFPLQTVMRLLTVFNKDIGLSVVKESET